MVACPIDAVDLLRLAALAAEAEAELFERHPGGSGRYAGRLPGRVLCQGAALHFVNQENGVKDFDAWILLRPARRLAVPARWRATPGLSPSKSGR